MPVNCVPGTPASEAPTPTSSLDPYIVWQNQHKQPLFNAGGIWWRGYKDILVPAAGKPLPTPIPSSEAKAVLAESHTYLLRYFTRTSGTPTEFWHVLCNDYNFEKLPGKMRTKIRRAYKDCAIRRIQAAWLVENGYPCYLAAFSRYKGGRPESKETFQKRHSDAINGPFEYWGAFIGETLVGFAKCIVGKDYATMVVFKFDPRYAVSRPAYALLDTVLQTYVTNAGMPVNNGYRALAHDTNMQDFVLQFGFRRVYTDLRVIYRPPLHSIISMLYPFSSVISRLPTSRPIEYLKTLLKQEQIQRSCLREIPEAGPRPEILIPEKERPKQGKNPATNFVS